MNYFHRRRTRKMAHEVLRHAKHLRNMRQDIMRETDLRKLDEAENEVRKALKIGDMNVVENAASSLYSCIGRLAPYRSFPAFRENFEILVVAIVVAMAFRTYFIQPYKIPTGSMQPTLYGIHSVARLNRSLTDKFPLKLTKWLIYGEWHREVRAGTTGHLIDSLATRRQMPSYCIIGDQRHKIPRNARLNFANNDYVNKGALLWSGIVTAGDHVFVDKVRWNFRKPKRGDIMVFSTDKIPSLPPKTHYIKRLVGLPGERIAIDQPNLKVDGHIVREPDTILDIAVRGPGYINHGLLPTPDDAIILKKAQYFALGDNTVSSRDSRYWGAVPERNLVGPAFMIYWPFSKRWGLVNRHRR